MVEVGSKVIALHGAKGYVRGEVVVIDDDQVKIKASQYADVDFKWRNAAAHELVANALLRYCEPMTQRPT